MKFIIDNKSKADEVFALRMVMSVIDIGMLSDKGRCYCYATVFSSGFAVTCIRNSKSFKFVVLDHEVAE